MTDFKVKPQLSYMNHDLELCTPFLSSTNRLLNFPLLKPISGPRQAFLLCPHTLLPRGSGPPVTLPLCSPATESTALPPLSEPTLPPWSAGEVRRVEPSVAAVLPSSSEAGAERVMRAVTGKNPFSGRRRQTTQRGGHNTV